MKLDRRYNPTDGDFLFFVGLLGLSAGLKINST